MLYIVMGPGGVGKNCLVEQMENTGFAEFLCTDTTRPKRPGEVNGVTYNFRSEAEFSAINDSDGYLEVAQYHTVGSKGERWTWYYGTPRKEFEKAASSPQTFVTILTPAGKKALINAGIPHISILLTASRDEIEHRMIEVAQREINEARRRIDADEIMFKDVDADIVVDTSGLTPEDVFNKLTSM